MRKFYQLRALLLVVLFLPLLMSLTSCDRPLGKVIAIVSLKSSANSGDPKAQLLLGFCYEEGRIVGQDSTEALHWYRKAADNGYAKAQLKLGLCYAQGQGVKKDYAEAVRWFRLAADQGDRDAQSILAKMGF